MRQAMATAEVGDDVWGEDPTVIRLQQRVAALLGKEAALFVPSGSMANQIALKVHTRPGDEVLMGWGSHCLCFEGGAMAAVSGVQHRLLGREGEGTYTAEDLRQALQPKNVHLAPTSLVWLENTHNRGSGRIFPQPDVQAIAGLAHQQGFSVHLDGARLLNAAVASGAEPAALVAPVDSTSICLSKGLGAPVGSVLAGSQAFITSAHRYRKMLGGAMRQVGILAAAGLYALSHNVQRLAEDHDNASLLARSLAKIPGVALDPGRVQTNIAIFDLQPPAPDAAAFLAACAERGLLLSQVGPRRVRAVTHMDVDRQGCQRAAQIVAEVLLQAA
jgi:threonine aldolase